MKKRNTMLGIMLTKAEESAIVSGARRKGLTKSSYARCILIEQLTAHGALDGPVNPAPLQGDEITRS